MFSACCSLYNVNCYPSVSSYSVASCTRSINRHSGAALTGTLGQARALWGASGDTDLVFSRLKGQHSEALI